MDHDIVCVEPEIATRWSCWSLPQASRRAECSLTSERLHFWMDESARRRTLADGCGNLRIKSGLTVVHSSSCRPYGLFKGLLSPSNVSYSVKYYPVE